jgi:selenium metabolism protein YedF
MTKQAIDAAPNGATIVVMVDNDVSSLNVERFLRDNGMAPRITREESVFSLRFEKTVATLAAPDAAAYCLPQAGPNVSYVVTLASDAVGRGPVELGRVLAKGLIETLKVVEPAPTHLILYSSGILLAVDDSPLADSLRAIEARGIKVMICGTCVEHYGKKDEIHVGQISNMLSLLEVQIAAGKIISP